MNQRPKQKKSSRERLLTAAKELFAEHGYDVTTTAAVARSARTSQSQLLKHFRDKAGLLQELLDEEWKLLNSALRLALPQIAAAAERFTFIIDMFLNFLKTNPQFGRIWVRDGDRLRETNTGMDEFNAMLDSVLEQLVADGKLRSNVSPRALRVGLMGAFKGMLRETIFNRHERQLSLDNEARAVFSNFFNSCVYAPEDSKLRSTISEQIEEEPWLNHYLELADVMLRVAKPGQA